MKNFRLIKKYPGSPNTLGLEIKQNGTFYHSDFCTKGVEYFHQSFNPENHPEFWEEIQEKEYRILSLYIRRAIKHDICDVRKSSQDYILDVLKCDGNKIHSIKRLSDGEIFTIGDKCHLSNGNYYNFELKEFKFFTNGQSGHLEKHRNKTWLKLGIVSVLHKDPVFFYLEDMVKTKIPSLRTEDGIDIFAGNIINSVHKRTFQISYGGIIRSTFVKNSDYLYFSTKEAADEYVLMNKPCLSVNDVMNVFNYGLLETKNQLKDLVKNKLPQS